MAIDIGIVLVSITIFDKHNKIFPKKIVETGKAKSLLTDSSYFEVDQSFYSTEHGGTFHFAHFNINFFKEFIDSNAFKVMLDFVEQNQSVNKEPMLLKKLEKLKMVFEDPISPLRQRSNSTPVQKGMKKQEEETKEEVKNLKAEKRATSLNKTKVKVGGGFPSAAMLEKIKEKYGVIRDLGGLQLL